MKKSILFIIIFAILGLIVGYLIFGRISGEYVDIDLIFRESQSGIEKFGRKISGIATMRQNILISGGVGAVVGFIISLVRKK
ncbi:MAG: hypothetical protein ACLFUH_08795 [Bacteroidales bacterium]